MDSTEQMKALMAAMGGDDTVQTKQSNGLVEIGHKADGTGAMKVLLESIDAPEVDEPKDAYANAPNEQTLDSQTQQNFGRDLNKKKAFQSPRKAGDNTKAGRMQLVDLEEERLTDELKKFKLTESAWSKQLKWDTRRELAELMRGAIEEVSNLLDVISTDQFNIALQLMWDNDWNGATDEIMQWYGTSDGGEPRDWQAIAEDLADNLKHIATDLNERPLPALESTGEVNHSLTR